MIHANSPQAKGRVERKNGVLQDRLVKELRLRRIDEIEPANAFLPQYFENLNARQAKPPASPIDAHRRAPKPEMLNDILCREKTRIVQNDWTVRFQNKIYQIPRQHPMAMPGQAVTVRIRLDGTMAIIYRGNPLDFIKLSFFTNKAVTPPLGVGGENNIHQPQTQRGHF